MKDGELSVEAIRLFRRYAVEIVEELNLCPWAERARTSGAMKEAVVLAVEPRERDLLAAISELEQDPKIEIGIVLFPRLRTSYGDFSRFVSRSVEADAGRWELGTAPFAMAAFHPDAPCDTSNPERLVPFIRRTPDPTVQLVRRSSLERVRDGFAEGTAFVDVRFLSTLDLTRNDTLPLRERIARANHRTVTKLGVAAVEELLRDIQSDRDRSYGALGESAGAE